jgi:vancomycin resistance protein YoaR
MEQATNEAVAQKTGGSRLKQTEKKGGGKVALAVVGGVLAVAAVAYVGLCAYASSRDTFQPNRRINGIDVGGMTVEEAQATLEQELLGQEITLSDPDNGIETTITVADLGYTAEDLAGSAQYWMDADQNQSFLRKGWAYVSYVTGRWPGGSSWPDMDAAALDETISRLSEELSQPSVDSTYEVQDSAISITNSKDGLSLNTTDLRAALMDISTYSQEDYQVPLSFDTVPAQTLTAQEIYDEVASEMKNATYDAATGSIIAEQRGADFDVSAAQAALDAAEPSETITVPATIEYPTVTAENLKAVLFRDVLGTATTKVSGTTARKGNVQLSAKAINGTVLNHGDVFSYNETVGQRTAERGYQAAPAYVQGETVDEIGGGICQTSSTLYYACLLSNLEITERYAHRYVPAYIMPGVDATVSWGGPDYKFTNNTDYPIKIVTSYSDGYLTVKLLGTKTDNITVKMTNELLSTTPYETIEQEDSSLAAGTETVKTTPYTGYKYKTYRNLYDGNGKLISTTYEATSDYKSRNKVVLVGTKAAAQDTSSANNDTTPSSTPSTTPSADTNTTQTGSDATTTDTPADSTSTEDAPIFNIVTPENGG